MTEGTTGMNADNLCELPAGKDHDERKSATVTVLLADRLPAMREHVSKVLTTAVAGNLHTLEASDGEQALVALTESSVQLAIIETTQPGINGLQFSKALW